MVSTVISIRRRPRSDRGIVGSIRSKAHAHPPSEEPCSKMREVPNDLTVNTGQGARRITFSATLPNSIRSMPDRTLEVF